MTKGGIGVVGNALFRVIRLANDEKMMKIYWILPFFLSILWSNIGNTQTENYYIELKKNTLEIGQYLGENFKKKPLKTYPYGKENIAEIKQLLFQNGDEEVLYYFHCLFGGMRLFHKTSLQQLNQGNTTTKVVSIVWHAPKMGYKKNWEASIQLGETIQFMMSELWSIPAKSNRILCHSMGHRIFTGAFKSVDYQVIKFEWVVLAAADLDMDIFEKDLTQMPEMSKKIVAYIHLKDKLLKASTRKHGRKRLGLHGLEKDDFLDKIGNLERIDVTNSSGKRVVRTTNHSYFKRDKMVLKDIYNLMKNNSTARFGYLHQKEDNIWRLE